MVEFGEVVFCSPLVREPLSEQAAGDLAAVFKALGDPVRLRLFSLIASHAAGEACVCDLTGEFDVSQPTISHHLKVLRDAGVTQTRCEGVQRFVSLREDDVERQFPGLLTCVLTYSETSPAN